MSLPVPVAPCHGQLGLASLRNRELQLACAGEPCTDWRPVSALARFSGTGFFVPIVWSRVAY